MFWGNYTLESHVGRVQVTVGDKTEMRAIESINTETGQIMPVHADHELVAHTVDGRIMIIPNVVPFKSSFAPDCGGCQECPECCY
jgi:hypothetical protein